MGEESQKIASRQVESHRQADRLGSEERERGRPRTGHKHTASSGSGRLARPCAAMSETSSNWWKIRVIHETGCWEYSLGRASRTFGWRLESPGQSGGNDRQCQGF